MSKKKRNRGTNTPVTPVQSTPQPKKNIIEVVYDDNTLETLISVNGKSFDTSRINGKEIADWAYPFMMRKVRWNGFYDEMVQALGGQKAFDLVFEGSDEALAELREAWENAPVNVVSGSSTENVVVIVYDENTLTTEITVNGQPFDTSRINGKEIADWVYPFMMRKVKWEGIFEELAKVVGSQEYTIQFSGSNAAMNELMEECPESVSIQKNKGNYLQTSNELTKKVSSDDEVFNTFVSLNKDKRHQEAFDYAKSYADKGNAGAQYSLFISYHVGKIVPQDEKIAQSYLKKSAEQGYAKAQYELGLLTHDNNWLLRSAEQGYSEAQYLLGELYLEGDDCPQDDDEAFKWIKKAAEQGLAEAQAKLGNLYFYGWGTAADSHQAAEWYKKAADQNDADGQYGLARCYIDGDGVEQDEGYAVDLLTLAAENGHSRAQFRLGDLYYYGDIVENDDFKAVKWYKASAEQDDKLAQFALARCYMTGEGIDIDEYESIKWLKKSAKQGYADAENTLGCYYIKGIGVEKSIENAYKLFKSAAENGNTDAMVNLSMLLFDEDDEEAENIGFKFAEKAAENGHPHAMYLTALCYGSGIGVEENLKKAFDYAEMGAKAGDVDAICMVADFLVDTSENNIIEADYSEAYDLYKLVVETDENCGYAYYKLGLLNYFGLGVQKNEQIGLEYIEKAAELDEDDAIEFLDNIEEEKAEIQRFEKRYGMIDEFLDIAGMIPGASEFISAIKFGKRLGEGIAKFIDA